MTVEPEMTLHPRTSKDLLLAPVAAAIDFNLQRIRDRSSADVPLVLEFELDHAADVATSEGRVQLVLWQAIRDVDLHGWKAAISEDAHRLTLSGGSLSLDLGLSAGLTNYIKHGAAVSPRHDAQLGYEGAIRDSGLGDDLQPEPVGMSARTASGRHADRDHPLAVGVERLGVVAGPLALGEEQPQSGLTATVLSPIPLTRGRLPVATSSRAAHSSSPSSKASVYCSPSHRAELAAIPTRMLRSSSRSEPASASPSVAAS